MKRDLSFGGRALRRILDDLEKPAGLEHDYAVAILEQARRNASRKPTPQARMAASIMEVRGSELLQAGSSDQPAVEVAMGSEFGSGNYPQFHAAHDRGGYWLYPATRDRKALDKADKSLEQVLQRAVRGF